MSPQQVGIVFASVLQIITVKWWLQSFWACGEGSKALHCFVQTTGRTLRWSLCCFKFFIGIRRLEGLFLSVSKFCRSGRPFSASCHELSGLSCERRPHYREYHPPTSPGDLCFFWQASGSERGLPGLFGAPLLCPSLVLRDLETSLWPDQGWYRLWLAPQCCGRWLPEITWREEQVQ